MLKPNDHITQINAYLLKLQKTICTVLEQEDAQEHFNTDKWEYQQGQGGGQSCVLEKGAVFEKAGVNISHVIGDQLPAAATANRPQLKGRRFQALGLSLVIHPDNPFIPTTHMNVRFIIAEKNNEPPVWWFGGGYDLTPYYPFDDDCVHWHQTAKAACDPFGSDLYDKYKAWCDRYFYLPHRNEARGIGGIFFDDVRLTSFDTAFAFMQSVGNSFLKAYLPIVQQRKVLAYTKDHKAFQAYRRGRYVEFNLLHDRGTLFGIQSGGRTESILMSLPPKAAWHYNWTPTPGSQEERLHQSYLTPRDWLSLTK